MHRASYFIHGKGGGASILLQLWLKLESATLQRKEVTELIPFP
jgi:hypothetical protein